MPIYFTLCLVDFILNVLGFKLSCTTLLVHDIDGLLLTPELPIDVLKLSTQSLGHLSLCSDTLLQLFVLHHLLRGGTAQVRHLRVQLALQIV